jgi:hypothetical protein
MEPAMHRNVETFIGRLATDPQLLERFARQPRRVLDEQGLDLSEIEVAALVATDPDVFRALASALDARLCRASRAGAVPPLRHERIEGSERDPGKETKR